MPKRIATSQARRPSGPPAQARRAKLKKGYSEEFAVRLARQVEGFGSCGFPESHGASFALLVYVSCWLKRHHPDAMLAALLNSQPVGFYAPA
ncbi:hypothetical protein [Variovorax sp. GT1P44]|uniref:hypothetical protein n=1 Tax=Variovorax sp. GT1P44 TaxID=3443742 RepID=UPI003F463664